MQRKGATGRFLLSVRAPAYNYRCDASIKLPKATWTRGKPLFDTFKRRRTIREMSEQALSLHTLANLVWAAFGVNRQRGPFGLKGRTAASAGNSQEIEVYIALPKATYRYDPFVHALLPIGLAAWFHNCNKAALFKKLGLRADQRVLFAQTVGYPAIKETPR